MFFQSFRQVGLSLLAASAVSLGAVSLGAQTAPAPPAGPNPSRVDIFTGYSYFGPHGTVKPAGTSYSSVNYGAIGSGAYYFTKYFGAEASYAAHPGGNNDGFIIAAAGPIFRAPMQNFTLFGHGLAGGAQTSGPARYGPGGGTQTTKWGPSLTVGGGMDYDLPFFDHRFSFRLFQADYVYIHEDYGPAQPALAIIGGRANIGAAQLSTGFVTHFGHIIPPPPVGYTCVAAPGAGFAGDPITITGTAINLNPKKPATYSWTSDGGKISGTSNVANVDTTGLNPGTYNVKGNVSEGKKAGEFADCAATFVVSQPLPPTISCSASPSSVAPGGSSTITAMANSPQNRPLTYSYSSTAGSVSGSTSTATLSTVGAAPGTITITCNVVDDKGQSATATTSVSVIAPPAPVRPTTSSLCSITFDKMIAVKKPTRVDNEAKACLDDIALNLQRSSEAKVGLVGNAVTSEKNGSKFAAERAVNAKDYLVKEKGIDPSRIMVYSGNSDANTVAATLVPAGATAGSMGTAVDETTVKPMSAAPVKKHVVKKKKKK